VTIEYLDLADFLVIAEEITGIEVPVLMKMSRLSLADSALHAPQAGYGDVDLYPDFIDKAAVLLVRLVMNHPLPDGNKRAGWVSMRMFVAINEGSWDPHPDVDDAERTVMGIASGDLDEAATAAWLRQYLVPPAGGD
jgi:death-on-curing protein